MDQGVARQLFEEGAALVLLDVPARTEFGMDYSCWTVGPRFKGVKMIPPGFHFVFYSAVSKEGQSAPRTGFFHFFQRQEVVVRRWDPATEDLTEDGITAETTEGIRAGLQDLDRSLGAYPYESLRKWVSLTSHISEELVARTQPPNGKISSVTQLQPEEPHAPMEASPGVSSGDPSSQPPTAGQGAQYTPGGVFAGVGEFPPTLSPSGREEAGMVAPQLPQLKYKPEAALRFSEIPHQRYPVGATPTQITHYNMDLSYTLETMLKSCYGNREMEILGELQFSFVCFLVGHVYDAFEHWKNLVKLLCSCEEALGTHKDLFTSFISVLHFQLKEIPEDFFVDIVSRNNFLTTTLQIFFSSLEGSRSADRGLVKRGLQFRENITKRYKWDFSAEPEDFAPTIVET